MDSILSPYCDYHRRAYPPLFQRKGYRGMLCHAHHVIPKRSEESLVLDFRFFTPLHSVQNDIVGQAAVVRVVGQGVPNCELFVGRFESRQADHISKMSKP